MDRWNLIIDVAACENCNNCVLAAKDEFVGNDFPGYSAPHAAQGAGVIRIQRKVRGSTAMVDAAYLPVMCNHCDDGPCLKAGADGSVKKRDDGIVIIDPVKAKGRRDLVDACPYGAIVWNEEQQLPQTWFFDAHLLDGGWKAPRCVPVCPTGAIEAVKISDADMAARVRQQGLRSLHPEWETRPRVHYRQLGRFDRLFLGGSVVQFGAGVSDCCEGARVFLRQDGSDLAETTTDAFGDFKFDELLPNSGTYDVLIVHPQAGHGSRRVSLGEQSIYLVSIALADESSA